MNKKRPVSSYFFFGTWPGTGQKKFFGHRWVLGTSEEKKLVTDEYRVPAKEKFLDSDGYQVLTKF